MLSPAYINLLAMSCMCANGDVCIVIYWLHRARPLISLTIFDKAVLNGDKNFFFLNLILIVIGMIHNSLLVLDIESGEFLTIYFISASPFY